MKEKIKEVFMTKALTGKTTSEDDMLLRQGIGENELKIISKPLPLEILKEIIELNKNKFNLKKLIRNITVKSKFGIANYSEIEDDFLEEVSETLGQVKNDKIKNISWELKKYGKIYGTSNDYLEDNELYYDYFKNKISKILINTENRIIYNEILKHPRKLISSENSNTLRMELRNLFKNIGNDDIEKNVYMSLNLLDQFSFISDMNGKLLITDNPLVPNGKLLCGKPIIIIPNNIFKPVNGKEILVYGNLLDSIALFELKTKDILATEKTKRAFEEGLIDTRVLGYYDCKAISTDNFIIAEIDLGITA